MPSKEKPYCSGTMTEAAFRGWILSALRNLTRKWKPASDALKKGTRAKPVNVAGRHRIEHKCADCGVWAPKKSKTNTFGIELDHIVPIGGLSSFSKLQQWITNAFVEVDGYQKLCTDCHKIKTQREKQHDR
jgi:hypothetical protein